MNRKEAEAILDSVVIVLRPLKQELAELQARVDTMEAAPLKFIGEHQPGRLYAKNALVTCRAGACRAKRATQQTPGDGDAWQDCGAPEAAP